MIVIRLKFSYLQKLLSLRFVHMMIDGTVGIIDFSTGFDLTNGKSYRFLAKVYQGDIRIARMINTG